jgi:hypothetical protein
MKRRLLLLVGLVVIAVSLFALRFVLAPRAPVAHSGLLRVANSAYKYDLCSEAYAFAFATPDNPYKTDYTFQDPFRKGNDTIIPHLLNYDAPTRTITFNVDIIINRVATFHIAISHVHELDGIYVLLPDSENHLRHSNLPQFIISWLGKGGNFAILDYTCPNQWTWKAAG